MSLNITHVTRNPIVFSSAIIVAVGWFILFIGTCISGFKGVVWWIIIYELGLILGIFYVLMKSAFPDYRLLILTCLAISITLLIQTIDSHLHVGMGSAKASAAGGIMIITMQFFWVIVFGSTPESWFHSAVYGLPSSSSATPASAKYYDNEGAMPLSTPTQYSMSQHDSIHSGFAPMDCSVQQQQQQQQQQAYIPQTTTTYDPANNAIALHPYTANPDDPNELSFYKGEVLEILDRRGNWWQARKQDQTIGIVPSNYFTS
ncbi:uncharacterized protein BX664DRAFT_339007 [Halteromyces radiatus]|uniref:uncharacterized protein n=1 Tax=Halteromyces radiatus TaxID=101107 RepID=UPI00221FB94D|nr:uncharacterized protein BX664DRAFT_339007 [Halteromyces radiatus]KAI8082766.1 hypothetical protein BX664DRAFT_339007 [Halteromyces radiatus]